MTDTNFELEPEKEYTVESIDYQLIRRYYIYEKDESINFDYVLCERCGHLILTKPDACYFCPQCHQRGGACE